MRKLSMAVAVLGLVASPAFAAVSQPATGSGHAIRMAGDQMTAALNLLEAKGYADFSNFRANGGFFTAKVAQNGRRFSVRINPQAQTITPIG